MDIPACNQIVAGGMIVGPTMVTLQPVRHTPVAVIAQDFAAAFGLYHCHSISLLRKEMS
jgi:hypothetical protein